MAIIVSLLISILTAVLLYYIFFRDWDEFIKCLYFWIMPDIISAFRGEYWDDRWAEAKLLLWITISALEGILVYAYMTK